MMQRLVLTGSTHYAASSNGVGRGGGVAFQCWPQTVRAVFPHTAYYGHRLYRS